MILPFYKLLLRLKKYIDIDEIRGGGIMDPEIQTRPLDFKRGSVA